LSYADDIRNLSSRIRDSGKEYAALIDNTRAQVQDLIVFRNGAGESGDEKDQELNSALDALQEAYETANIHWNITDEVLQKLDAVLGNG
jgi:uncharacterized protein YukE